MSGEGWGGEERAGPSRAAKGVLTPFLPHPISHSSGQATFSWQMRAYLSRGVSMANTIHVIVPYRHASTWVFDDPRVGLSQEPFVSGIPEMIDAIVANVPNAEKGFRLLFASAPFPGYQVKLE